MPETDPIDVACREGLEVATAVVWARGLLREGPRPKAEMVELAREQGLSRTMLRRVTRELTVHPRSIAVRGKAIWSLPDGTARRDWRSPRAIGRFPRNFQSRGGGEGAARLRKGPRDWRRPARISGRRD
jgi:hypothetical protein